MPSAESRCDAIKHRFGFFGHFWIAPIGDVHYNAPMHADDALRDWCALWKARIKAGETVLFLGMGDYLETLSGSERKAMAGVHESTREWMDDRIMEDVEGLVKELAFTKGRWLGWITGNHDYINGEGMSVTQMLASRLGGTAFGVEAWIRLMPEQTHGCRCGLKYDVWAHHGVGGGMTAGATLNALERVAAWAMVDCVLMGHHHAQANSPLSRLEMVDLADDKVGLKERPVRICRTGGTLKSHEPGRVSYATAKAMKPAPLGAPEIKVTFKRTQRKKQNLFGWDTKVTQ